MSRIPVLVRFQPDRLARIDAEAKRTGKPRSEAIEALIDRGLSKATTVIDPLQYQDVQYQPVSPGPPHFPKAPYGSRLKPMKGKK